MSVDKGQCDAALRPGDSSETLLCEICSEVPSKYTCPACRRKTCSLGCVTQHKERFSCSGKRDVTAFVKRGDLSYDTLVSDYKFLEEIQRIEDVSKRTQPPTPRRQLPKQLKNLVHQAKARGVALRLMSPGMKRRRNNSTRFDFKTKTMYWRVQWKFSNGQEAVTQRMSEHAVIKDVVEGHLTTLYRNQDCEKTKEPGPVPRPYSVYMRQEGAQGDQAENYEVNPSATLGQFLDGKQIIEYPVFRVEVKPN
jgi:hypothetical protein